MIDREKTYKKYQYYPEDLNKYDYKPIIVVCDICNIEIERKKRNYTRKTPGKDVCKKCSLKKGMEKTGFVHATQIPGVKEKIKNTCIERYGVENPLSNQDIREKITDIIQKKYGVNHPMLLESVKDKIRQTNILKYGVDNPAKSKEIQQKIENTCLQKYGVKSPLCLHFERNTPNGKQELQVKTWINSFGYQFHSTQQVIKPKQIDLYDDALKIGIEYCGLYWHSIRPNSNMNKDYHYNKYKQCLDQGIRLITIFSDEWKGRQTQVKGHILSVLGKYDKRVFARKCLLKQPSVDDVKAFVNTNHIQSLKRSPIYYNGLYYDNELVGVITFNLHHRNNSLLVLDRLCFKIGWQVVGGASKLFTSYLSEIKLKYGSITSWSDNRWASGIVYEKLGFKLDKELKSDYSYVDLNRSKIRIGKQSMKGKDCAHLVKIWDCGKKRWVYEL